MARSALARVTVERGPKVGPGRSGQTTVSGAGASPRSSPSSAPFFGSLRDLQRTAGNAAVAALVLSRLPPRSPGPQRPGLPLQRYISGEHKDAGDAATARTIVLDLWVGGSEPFSKTRQVSLTYGDVNALMDLYENWTQIKKAPAPEVERLVDLFKKERDALAAKKPVPSDSDYEAATVGRKAGTGQAGAATKTYFEMAEENVDHFTPDNHERYTREHKAALKRGVEAFNLKAKGKTAEADVAETDAFLINGAADHYMQDAFAAGHLINKPLIELATLEYWSGGIATAAADNIKAAAAKDQARIWGEIQRNVLPHLSTGQRIGLALMDQGAAINAVLDQILGRLDRQPDKLANLGAKLVHDFLNESGVQVFSEDDPTTGWRTFGDSFMAKGDTKAHIVAAQKASIANVESAIADGLGQTGTRLVNIDTFLKTHDPWRLAPRWAEVPKGTRREVGTAVSDKSWVQDLLKTLIFSDAVTSPLYLLLLKNLSLVGDMLTAEEQTTATRRTTQAPAVEKLLKKFSKNFAKGGAPDDANTAGLARALKGKPGDLVLSVIDALEPHNLDDGLAEEYSELHDTRAKLVALDTALLLGMQAAMEGGVTWPGESAQIRRISSALRVKTGKRLVAQLPAKLRKPGAKTVEALGAQEGKWEARVWKSEEIIGGTHKFVFQAKELAADLKGKDASLVLGVIREIFLSSTNATWMVEFAALHSDAELAALDVGILDAMRDAIKTWEPRSKQKKRIDKASAAAKAAGATSGATADVKAAVPIVKARKFETYTGLAAKLKGKDPELIREALSRVGGEHQSAVTAEFVQAHTDDELAALDPGLLHSLKRLTQDAGAVVRVDTALQRNIKETTTRVAV
jgi:hypothetical protein